MPEINTQRSIKLHCYTVKRVAFPEFRVAWNTRQDLGGHSKGQGKEIEPWCNMVRSRPENTYGSLPHEMAQLALIMCHVPEDIQVMLDDYFSGFRMRISTIDYTTPWIVLSIVTGCTIPRIICNDHGCHTESSRGLCRSSQSRRRMFNDTSKSIDGYHDHNMLQGR
ncbi:reverse transcriptase [Elysia marginata]|uniref:Reverse transcriptase n=1 Tax=Elysia marginata TaxID=1093978 RepID=A0AAV4HB55_9GAST|nr:reverse transcriptase [Elysia marginata]